VNRDYWELKNHLMEIRCCDNCRWYKHFDDELVPADDVGDLSESFCRAMREDGVEYYYFGSDHEERSAVCDKWLPDGSR